VTSKLLALSTLLVLAFGGPIPLPAQSNREAPAQLEALRIAGAPVPGENKIIGNYGQPEWTARRRFTLGSVYVQPEEQFEAEFGWQRASFATQPDQHEFNQELEIGLPHRWQLNVESAHRDFREDRPARRWHHDSAGLGLRYAPADWGKLPLNPTLGVSWKGNSGAADAVSGQLILATELSPRWHWGATLLHERQTGGPRRRESTVASGVSFSVINETLSVGLEGRISRLTEQLDLHTQNHRSIGPSVQWRPVDQLHFDFAPLWGSGRGAARREVLVFVGFEFGDGADDGDEGRKKLEPASTRKQ
jgi:hypothetical protein